jgi:hypothetical protein
MAGKQQDKLIIDDFDACVIQKMLEFAYDKKVELGRDVEFVEKILMASGKYGVEKLKVSIIWGIKINIFYFNCLGSL